jgi:putative ABC transport system substrate-binding protein
VQGKDRDATRDLDLPSRRFEGLHRMSAMPRQLLLHRSKLAAHGALGALRYGQRTQISFRMAGKPADLPVQMSTKFELVINLKTAKALGLTIPQSLPVGADEVIE